MSVVFLPWKKINHKLWFFYAWPRKTYFNILINFNIIKTFPNNKHFKI
jgi:hypothetical protein